ncbi:xanthine dehydrogenase family protein molybdopterin-binding subunit [Deinococcus sp. HMF7604]|uniref:xanthine dehydrogenase family protein molybdopterin-binding subunit n=1 Tax=Deinococcus betulae TaxID=2873312 RepID=UPI001CCD960F|nr:xanthine dehydrogenase family protein molybdopterin-binding subunit [Deinococcus betulae]
MRPAVSGQQTPGNVGQDRVRVDGPLKVTGTAPYAYEQAVQNPAYLFPLTSAIAKGTIRSIDDAAARAVPGVLTVMTHHNAPKLLAKTDNELYILQSPDVHYRGEYIGAVIAESVEVARHAASLVQVEYDVAPHDAQFRTGHPDEYAPKRINTGAASDSHQGNVTEALAASAVTVDAVYTTPYEHHNPMEMHSIIAEWDRERLEGVLGILGERPHLRLYDATQGASFAQLLLAPVLGLLPAQIEIISPYVGGAFGSKGIPHAPTMLTALAAKLLPGRAVKYMLTRQQMFRSVGHRLTTHQRFRLGAQADGILTAIAHNVTQSSSRLKQFAEQTVNATRHLYAAPNRETTTRMVPLDIAPATFMRAPGEFPGMFAQETAMDELAVELGLDPIELRIRNEPDNDPESGKPHSSRHLVECLREGARLFGWETRLTTPRGRQVGEWLYGLGVASATYPKQQTLPTKARITFTAGRYAVQIAAADLGTGAWTILQQIAADALNVQEADIKLQIGRTDLPFGYLAGGSTGTYNWGSAIMVAAVNFREKHGQQPAESAEAEGGAYFPDEAKKHVLDAYGAHFAEVKVSAVTGEVRVTRMLGVYDPGRIINPRTANSQFIGGMTMGISAALQEESYLDPRFGHVVNGDFAGYHIAVNADAPDVQARWIEHPDPLFGPTGAKGIGEIGIVGVPAAIGNAIYNATGKRLRALPFTPDKLMD